MGKDIDHEKLLKLCIKYIHCLCCIEDIGEGLYALEIRRIELHKKISDFLGIDHQMTKQITDNIDLNGSPMFGYKQQDKNEFYEKKGRELLSSFIELKYETKNKLV